MDGSSVSDTPRSALITGATRGIGRGIAERLASLGWMLTISARSADLLGTVAEELVGLGAKEVVVAAADLADREAVSAVVDEHAAHFTSLDVLVLNAGVGTAGPIAGGALHRVDKTMEVNFRSALALVSSAIPLMRSAAALSPARGAKIIALASITGVFAEPGLAAYGASKAALISLIETINLEEADNGITATAIAPGFVDTDMSAWVTDRIPRDRMIPVDDVVAVVEMLVGLSRVSTIGRVVLSRTGSVFSA